MGPPGENAFTSFNPFFDFNPTSPPHIDVLYESDSMARINQSRSSNHSSNICKFLEKS